MINKKMEEAINKQINAELYSSYLYLSMSAYFSLINLAGFANWMRIQAQEELTHAMKFYDYINERGGKVILTKIEQPKSEWKSAMEAFEDTYSHECVVTGLINDLVNLAIEEKDHSSNAFLQWFVTEQVEEEASAQEILDKLKFIGDNGAALFMIDKDLGQRIFAAGEPSDT